MKRRRLDYLRRRKRRFTVLGLALLLALTANFVWNVLYIRLAAPAPKSAITPGLAEGDWATLQRDPQRTGYVPGQQPALRGTLLWDVPLNSPVAASPALADGVLYVSAGDGRVLAMEETDGSLLWERTVASPVDLPMVVAGDFVCAVQRNGVLVALDKSSGALLWEFRAPDSILAAPLVHEGVIYLAPRDQRLYALDALTGEIRWTYKLTAYTLSSPAIWDGILAIGAEDGNIHLVDVAKGTPRRLFPTDRPIGGAPVVLDDRVFTINSTAYARAIDLYSREIPFEKAFRAWWWQFYLWQIAPRPPEQRGAIWLFSRRGETFSGNMAAAHGMLYFGGTRADSTSSLYALDHSSGELVWEHETDAPISGSPIVVSDTLYVASDDGDLFALDARTGAELWRLPLGARVNGGPVYGQDALFVTLADGRIAAVN